MMKWMTAIVLMALPMAAHAEVDKKTERLWKAKCATCHGADGKAKTDQGAAMAVSDMTAPAWQKAFTDAKIKEAITKGVARTKDGKKQQMDPFDSLDAAQVDALTTYIRTLK